MDLTKLSNEEMRFVIIDIMSGLRAGNIDGIPAGTSADEVLAEYDRRFTPQPIGPVAELLDEFMQYLLKRCVACHDHGDERAAEVFNLVRMEFMEFDKNLRTAIADLQGELRELQAKLDNVMANCKEYKREIERLTKSNKELQQTRIDVYADNRDLRGLLHKIDEGIQGIVGTAINSPDDITNDVVESLEALIKQIRGDVPWEEDCDKCKKVADLRKDRERLDALTAGQWHFEYNIFIKKWRIIEPGPARLYHSKGEWYDTPREAIDAAIKTTEATK